ncbi:glycoside hydrolase family 61 protein [Moniliophthora roreri MCA 2997]|uniref:AA9 family lytic polysaccharide monooxygenase n=2 Tax=Moniliophthora roreri TaxID=221103 RepID=V2YDD5_MONRO|nr:glycoside hydrolase family 61 protein [Moniliophthora roreri MCA 2997]KAI3596397.1 glycoside hydrolase family 61 protein [Moniliophthora roreri]
MFLITSLAVISSFLVSIVAAHGGVTSYEIAGVKYTGWSPYNSPTGQSSIERPYSTYDPILSPTASTISCNNNGQPSGSQLTATVKAGDSITAFWSQWTHKEGPVTVYMASCGGSCASANSNSLKWFKIAETGLKSGTVGNGVWGNTDVMNTLKYTTTIPKALADGEYLIRHELLALHQANTPQFYPECGQLKVTGGGGKTPSGSYLVSLPGAFSMSDPGVNINIYDASQQTNTVYKVPGPAVWNGQ